MSKSFLVGVTLVLMSCGKTGFEPLDALNSRSTPDGGVGADCSRVRNAESGCDAEAEAADDDTEGESTAPVGPGSGDDDPPAGIGGSTGPGTTPAMGGAGDASTDSPTNGIGGASTLADAGASSSGSASGGDSSSAGSAGSAGAAMGGMMASAETTDSGGDGTDTGGTPVGAAGAASGGTASGGTVSGGAGPGGSSSGGAGGSAAGGSSSGGAPAGGSGGAPSLPGCLTLSYGGHDYLMCGSEATWLAARDSCASIGMTLARVDSAEENQWLFDNVYDVDLPSDALWVGGTDASVEGEWLWPDGTLFWLGDNTGTAQGGLFTNWYNNHPGGNQFNDCMAIDLGAVIQPGWYADRCDTSTNVYACESI